ncbi:MAG: hypothetical protein EHM55_18580 [Acidobacteria bacterium]|nr:MAG: hypothetical protein EHM55_18580 [Acidobacteriota bacterium]
MRKLTAIVAVLFTIGLNAMGQSQTGQTPLATAPSTPPVPTDGDWPRRYVTASGAQLIVYQPQVASWENQRHAVLWAAVSYTPKGTQTPALGSLKVESDTSVALEERLVSFSDFTIAESKFPTLERDAVRTVIDEIRAAVPLNQRVISLDRVLANIDKSQIVPKNVEGVKADPPTIFFSKTAAILVNIDGSPIWSTIPGNDLKSAVNTNWDLFSHVPTATYYLRVDDVWLKAAAVEGPWSPAGHLPDSFARLPADDNWKDVKASLPGKTVSASMAPRVFLSTTSAELILLKGEPTYVPVPGAQQLLWIDNTESDVFRMGKTGPVYFLVAGRWFAASDFAGPWAFATPRLPDDFKKIPLEHPRSRVLASVPGTDQAIEAVLLAEVPQTARVSKTLQAPTVVYQGEPQFKPIEHTTVELAVNTDKDIVKVGDLYYMCFQGVWFMAMSPIGPWTVTGSAPAQIYDIPVSSPAYPITQVTVEDSTSDAVVFATSMAYTGLMVAWGTAVWGTGYYYPPYVHYGAYPVYYPRYPTYGYGAMYNPWTGSYARGLGAYGPYGGAGVGARYNPVTGTYARGAAVWGPYAGAGVGRAYNPRTGTYARGGVAYGPYGARGAAQAYNPRTGAYGATRQGANVYGNWGTSAVQRGDQWARTAHTTSYATGATTRAAQGSGGAGAVRRTGPTGSSFAGQSRRGDVYAGHDGNVYKKDGGSWQRYDKGSWNSVQRPSRQLNTDSRARSDGAARANQFRSMRSSGSWGSGSFRGGGRSGGRRR